MMWLLVLRESMEPHAMVHNAMVHKSQSKDRSMVRDRVRVWVIVSVWVRFRVGVWVRFRLRVAVIRVGIEVRVMPKAMVVSVIW